MTEELPREILEKALKLRNNTQKKVFLALFSYTRACGKPADSTTVARLVGGMARTYINLRLNELEDLGLVKVIKDGKVKKFEVIL